MVLFQSFSGISRSSLRIRYSELFIRSSIDWRPARSAVTLYTADQHRHHQKTDEQQQEELDEKFSHCCTDARALGANR